MSNDRIFLRSLTIMWRNILYYFIMYDIMDNPDLRHVNLCAVSGVFPLYKIKHFISISELCAVPVVTLPLVYMWGEL